MDNFSRNPYEHNRLLMHLVGLEFDDAAKTRLQFHRRCIIGFMLVLAIVIQVRLVATSVTEFQKMSDLMQTFLPTIVFSACYFNLQYNADLAARIRLDMRKHLSKLANKQEVNVMKKYTDENKIYTALITCAHYFYMGLLFFPSFRNLYMYNPDTNNTEFVLPVRIDYCLQNRHRYFPMLFLQWIGITVICTVGVAYYSMVIACVQHVCALFALVSVKIDQPMKKTADYSTAMPIAELREEINWIVSVIKCYNDAINFVDLLILICTKTYCIEIVISFAAFIVDFIYLFQLFDKESTGIESIKNCIFIIGSIAVVYSAFYMGQRLIDHSISVYDKCCQIPFYLLSIKTQKLVMMLTTRSLKPCSININGMMVTSHDVFAKIANTSYTFAILCYKLR